MHRNTALVTQIFAMPVSSMSATLCATITFNILGSVTILSARMRGGRPTNTDAFRLSVRAARECVRGLVRGVAAMQSGDLVTAARP